MEPTKVCRNCGKEKSLSEFTKHPGARDGYRNRCKKCKYLYEAERLRNNPEALRRKMDATNERKRRNYNPAKNKDEMLRWKFGISLDDYTVMFESQGGVCRICAEPPGERMLAVDHCHATKAIRGLLCNACNTGLGLFRDRLDLLIEAAAYLEENDGRARGLQAAS